MKNNKTIEIYFVGGSIEVFENIEYYVRERKTGILLEITKGDDEYILNWNNILYTREYDSKN